MAAAAPAARADFAAAPRLFRLQTMPRDEDELYQEHILEHYEDPYHRGHAPHATHAHEDDNPLCGDVVEIDLAVDPQGKIDEIYFDGDGCCISQAAASMLVEHFDQKSVDDVKRFNAEDMLRLFGAKLTPNRQKCCLLSWRVLQAAIYSPVPNNGQPKLGAQQSPARPGKDD
jgi:nitrogen fixation protein NifU and related proteins